MDVQYVCMQFKQQSTPMSRKKQNKQETQMYRWQGLRMHAVSYVFSVNAQKRYALFAIISYCNFSIFV